MILTRFGTACCAAPKHSTSGPGNPPRGTGLTEIAFDGSAKILYCISEAVYALTVESEMKLIACTAAAALAFAPMAGLANDKKPVVQTQQTAVLPEEGGIAQIGLEGFGFAPEFFIFAGIAAIGVAGVVGIAASNDDNNVNNTR